IGFSLWKPPAPETPKVDTRPVRPPAPGRFLSPARGDELACLPAGHHIDLQHWIGGRHERGREPQLAPDDVAPLRNRARLVEGDLAVTTLAAEATVARHDQAPGRNISQSLAD